MSVSLYACVSVKENPLQVGPTISGLSIRLCYNLSSCSFGGSDQALASPTETFTSGPPAGWSPFPPPDMTTVATGQTPPAVFHPLEWQPASPHEEFMGKLRLK
jgi:hypothetical protein